MKIQCHFDLLCNAVCRDLPRGWEVIIRLENGCGSVSLVDPGGTEHDANIDDASMSDSVSQAVFDADRINREVQRETA